MSYAPKIVLQLPVSNPELLPAFVEACLRDGVVVIAIVGESASKMDDEIDELVVGDGSERRLSPLGACPNSRCSILSESDSTLGDEQVFSPLEYRSDAAFAAECAGLRAERPCLAVYR